MRQIVIFFLLGVSLGTLSAQQSDETAKRALEREIKVSGNYLYGEAVGNTKEEAVKMAKTALVSEINKEALNHPEWQFAKSIQAKDVEYNTDMIDLMRGNKFRVIAYIKKANIRVVFDNKTPEIKVEDKKGTQKETQTAIQPANPQPTVEPTTLVQKTESVPAVQQPQPAPVEKKNADGLLGQILNASSMREIQKILIEYKRSGKIVSGSMDKLRAPEQAYLVVYKKTGEIVAILDKGNTANRKDLLSGEVKSNEILEQNQVIWFQLF